MEEKIKQSFFSNLFETKAQKFIWVIYLVFIIDLLLGLPDLYKTYVELSEVILLKACLELFLLTAISITLNRLIQIKK